MLNVHSFTEADKEEKRDYPSIRQSLPSPSKLVLETSSPVKPPSPTLPLPSRTTKLPPETNAKLMFFTMLGLLKLGDTDKKEHEMIWDVILEDKCARQSCSTTMTYFMKLKENQVEPDANKEPSKDLVFLNSQDFINASSSSSPQAQAAPEAEQDLNSLKKPLLPINLSTLLPVSKNSLGDVVELKKPTWLQSGTLNIPGLSSMLNKSLVKTGTPQEPPKETLAWPGIEAIKESYMKYHEGKFLTSTTSKMASKSSLYFQICRKKCPT